VTPNDRRRHFGDLPAPVCLVKGCFNYQTITGEKINDPLTAGVPGGQTPGGSAVPVTVALVMVKTPVTLEYVPVIAPVYRQATLPAELISSAIGLIRIVAVLDTALGMLAKISHGCMNRQVVVAPTVELGQLPAVKLPICTSTPTG
jgi:hypothetical protein